MPVIEDILGPAGSIARALADRFEHRPEQLAMADAVVRAMDSRSHLLVEAGTGVGKSFAYLVPAMLRAMHHAQTVVIATNTIALQEQLINKDIPLLREIIENDSAIKALAPSPEIARPLKPVLVKGRGNYISIRRMRLAIERQDRLLPDLPSRRSLHVIHQWSASTRDGSLASLPALERPAVWDRVQSDSGNCMGRRCPNYSQCFYQNARREMEDANLLVCNHALFFSDLALRINDVGFLPSYQHVILDEAHGIEDAASDHFGVSLSEGRVHHLLSLLYHPSTGRGYLPQLALQLGDNAPIDRVVSKVLHADSTARAFFESIRELVRERRISNGRLREPGLIDDILSPVMKDLSLLLKSLKDDIKNEQDKFELNSYAERAADLALAAEVLVHHKNPSSVYWAEVAGMSNDDDAGGGSSSSSGGGASSGGGRFQRVTLACSPIEVGPLLKEHLFSQPLSVVLTSATLATKTLKGDESNEHGEIAFAHTLARLGAEGAKTMQLGSPFDYRSQVELIIDRGRPQPAAAPSRTTADDPAPKFIRSGSSSTYVTALADRVLHHVRETQGGAFVLFTSFATLFAVADRLRRDFTALNLPLLVQGRDGPRTEILERFRDNENSVLFGAASFWQGVDVRGRGLRNVIITKLPFDPPDRPLTEARAEKILARGGDPFNEDSLPRAVIKFKQGFGRLIRSKTDTGRVVCLDDRLITARYAKAFLRSLPQGLEPKIIN
jgi:ATP-dependent DNA helicase DinG